MRTMIVQSSGVARIDDPAVVSRQGGGFIRKVTPASKVTPKARGSFLLTLAVAAGISCGGFV